MRDLLGWHRVMMLISVRAGAQDRQSLQVFRGARLQHERRLLLLLEVGQTKLVLLERQELHLMVL